MELVAHALLWMEITCDAARQQIEDVPSSHWLHSVDIVLRSADLDRSRYETALSTKHGLRVMINVWKKSALDQHCSIFIDEIFH